MANIKPVIPLTTIIQDSTKKRILKMRGLINYFKHFLKKKKKIQTSMFIYTDGVGTLSFRKNIINNIFLK